MLLQDITFSVVAKHHTSVVMKHHTGGAAERRTSRTWVGGRSARQLCLRLSATVEELSTQKGAAGPDAEIVARKRDVGPLPGTPGPPALGPTCSASLWANVHPVYNVPSL
jgi:hypothetical protein